MSKPAAIRATYSDFKLIKTRQVVSLSFEMPLADWNAVGHEVLGMPQPGSERWFAIAALQQGKASDTQVIPGEVDISTGESSSQPRQVIATAKPTRRSWDELTPTQQAGIRCGEPLFAKFLRDQHPDDWMVADENMADCVRLVCGVRGPELGNSGPRTRWLALENQYQAWLAKQAIA